jgi:mono/diheme cytochrome c family protein
MHMLLSLALAGVPTKRPEEHVKGRQVYDRSCWQCHGDDMSGNGPAAGALVDGVPDLRGKLDYKADKDALIFLVLDGRGDMPAFRAEFDKHDARRVLLYMERLEEGTDKPSSHKPEPSEEQDAEAEGQPLEPRDERPPELPALPEPE